MRAFVSVCVVWSFFVVGGVLGVLFGSVSESLLPKSLEPDVSNPSQILPDPQALDTRNAKALQAFKPKHQPSNPGSGSEELCESVFTNLARGPSGGLLFETQGHLG